MHAPPPSPRRGAIADLLGAIALAGLFSALGALASPLAAAAELGDPSAFDLLGYRPGAGASDFLGLHGARLAAPGTPTLTLALNLASHPLEVTLAATGRTYAVVSEQVSLDLLASVSATEWLELGAALPLVPWTGLGDGARVLPVFSAASAPGFGVGDLRLSAKARLPALPDALAVAFALTATAPTGSAYAGHDGATLAPSAIVDARLGASLRLVGEVGLALRPRRTLGPWTLDDELRFSVGAELAPGGASATSAVQLELTGARALADPGPEERALEARAAWVYRGLPNLELGVGLGLGLGAGAGTPAWRALASFRYAPGSCPYGPEDLDGWQDGDACADRDNDGDGVDDEADLCPNEPETVNNIDDRDGCPDRRPEFDPKTALAAAAATTIGDRDADGLDNELDACPDAPEDLDGFQDADGCPEPDDDGDGLPDAKDHCPRSAEIFNGVDDDDGCPDVATATLAPRGIVIGDTILFVPGRATLDPKSYGLLDQLAAIIHNHPEILRLEVAGHTDSVGSLAMNLALSEARASAVRDYLVGRGVDPARLRAVGYGPNVPLAPNGTEDGRMLNRRVELTILEIALPRPQSP